MRKHTGTMKLKGFMRAQIINKMKKVIGDTGWIQNQLTNIGFSNCFALQAIAPGQAINSMILGSESTPVSTLASLSGQNTDQNSSVATSFGTVGGTWTARCTQQFDGNNSSMATLGNVGLLLNSNTGSLAAGVGFATSSLGTDQSVNVTYDIQFS